jgi:outer membrane lipoprotein-sorting protein
MKKLLAIVVLGLFLASCTQQNRNNEYICNPIVQGNHQDLKLEILADKVKYARVNSDEFVYDILEEKSDRIIFGYKSSKASKKNKRIFYKKTKKLKLEYGGKDRLLVVYNCEKLN